VDGSRGRHIRTIRTKAAATALTAAPARAGTTATVTTVQAAAAAATTEGSGTSGIAAISALRGIAAEIDIGKGQTGAGTDEHTAARPQSPATGTGAPSVIAAVTALCQAVGNAEITQGDITADDGEEAGCPGSIHGPGAAAATDRDGGTDAIDDRKVLTGERDIAGDVDGVAAAGVDFADRRCERTAITGRRAVHGIGAVKRQSGRKQKAGRGKQA
jgi:hypothetical protein